MTKRMTIAFLAVLVCAPAFGQGLPTASPESVGLSAQRLERIGMAMQKNIDEGRVAGTVTLVARKGKAAWFKAQGMMDKEAGKAMAPDAIFRICSMTKPITSTAVMILYEEGRFLLNDPVSKYIPEFKNMKVLAKSPRAKSTPPQVRSSTTHASHRSTCMRRGRRSYGTRRSVRLPARR